jgi:hypothetical protein
VAWLRSPAANGIPLPGTPSARAASTVTAVMAFYEFHRLQGSSWRT